MSSNNENAPPQQERRRRSSIADIFTGRPSMDSSSSNGVMQKPVGSSMATAMAQAQQQSRRLSITALGLSGSPTRSQQQGPFDALRDRGQGSTGRPRRASEADETAIDEDGDYVSPMNRSRPNSPSARRVSFGTRVRVNTGSSSTGTAPDGPGSPTSSKTSSPPNAKKGKHCGVLTSSFARENKDVAEILVWFNEADPTTCCTFRRLQLGRESSNPCATVFYFGGGR